MGEGLFHTKHKGHDAGEQSLCGKEQEERKGWTHRKFAPLGVGEKGRVRTGGGKLAVSKKGAIWKKKSEKKVDEKSDSP